MRVVHVMTLAIALVAAREAVARQAPEPLPLPAPAPGSVAALPAVPALPALPSAPAAPAPPPAPRVQAAQAPSQTPPQPPQAPSQRPRPAPAPRAPAAPATPPTPPNVAVEPTPGQLLNIQMEVTIVTEAAGAPANRKTVSLTVADRQSGSVRSFDRNPGGDQGQLNVDVSPALQKNGRILTRVGLEYQSGREIPMVQIRAQPLLDSGKSLQISRAVSPAGDRSVTVEVTATILK